jgi:hypothetical protein
MGWLNSLLEIGLAHTEKVQHKERPSIEAHQRKPNHFFGTILWLMKVAECDNINFRFLCFQDHVP